MSETQTNPESISRFNRGTFMIARRYPTMGRGSLQEYESVWDEVDDMMQEQMAAGIDNPHRILRNITRIMFDRFLLSGPYQHHFTRVGITNGPNGKPSERIIVWDGSYLRVPFEQDLLTHSGVLAEVLTANPEIDCVVELGSGVGRGLFDLANWYEERGQPSPKLVACEPTDAGRRVTKKLLELASGVQMSVHYFNYNEPDFSFLQKPLNALFFTQHSIEQIPVLPRSVFDAMISHTSNCHCLHFEPVGWQFDQKFRLMRQLSRTKVGTVCQRAKRRIHWLMRRIDNRLGTSFGAGFPGVSIRASDIGRSANVSRNGAAWSTNLNYNTNLVSLLSSLEREHKIRLLKQCPNYMDDNPFNPSTMIHWAKAV